MRSILRYRWEIKAVSLESWEDVTVRCDNAVHQSVPFPEQWRTGLRFMHIGGAIQKAIDAASQQARGVPSSGGEGVARGPGGWHVDGV